MAGGNKKDLIYCEKCHKTLKRGEFYQSNNLEKYPDFGTIPICKKCLTMHVNNWDPDTFTPILKEVDVPYIPEEWNKLLASYGKDPRKVTGMTILGRYLSKMKLRQWNDFRWKDTEFLAQLAEKELRETLERQGKDIQEITVAVEESKAILPNPNPEPSTEKSFEEVVFGTSNPVEVDTGTGFIREEPSKTAEELGLTDEDILYLKLRWGKTYKPEDWIWLERFYRNFEKTYDIQTAGHKDTLMKLAKVSLRLDQLIDLGDIEAAQKTEKMYNSLMKSGSFTALQNKQEQQQGIDSIGEIVALCESKGFIPRYYVDTPKDKVDRVLQDMQEYTHSLIMEETNIGDLIENAVKQIQLDKEREQNLEELSEEEAFEESLFSENKSYLTDNDFHEFSTFEEELAEQDAELEEKEWH